MIFLGIDTSNYTTSMAAADDKNVIINEKLPLRVKTGECGLRQNNAVFAHVRNLPCLAERIGAINIAAVGYSAYPRDIEHSYMPCFEAGAAVARSLAALYGIPAYPFSHQAGHIESAIYSAGACAIKDGPFIAFHVSGGTTELLYIADGKITLAGQTLDLNAGQAIDRAGVMLGLQFPCGTALEALADNIIPDKPKICVRGLDCNLSGLENKVSEMIKTGYSPGEVAAYTIEFIKLTIVAMTENALMRYGKLPLLYAGGVMSNRIIRDYIKDKYDAYFAEPAFSSDNAAGIALLCREAYYKH